MLEARGGSDGHYAAAELDADGYVVVGDEAAFAESDGQLGVVAISGSCSLGKAGGLQLRRTLDLPEPESPIVTILLMKLYGCAACAMVGGGEAMRIVALAFVIWGLI